MADAPRKNRKVNGHGGGPIGGFQKPKETKKTVKRLLSYMGQHPVMLIVAFLCVIASALASVGATYITRPIINDIAAAVAAGQTTLPSLGPKVLQLLAVYIFAAACYFLQGQYDGSCGTAGHQCPAAGSVQPYADSAPDLL